MIQTLTLSIHSLVHGSKDINTSVRIQVCPPLPQIRLLQMTQTFKTTLSKLNGRKNSKMHLTGLA